VEVVVLDAGVVIALLDAEDVHHQAARQALNRTLLEAVTLVLPASAYAEVLVGPLRAAPRAGDVVDQLVDSVPFVLQALDRHTARRAAELRAVHAKRLPLPDALVAATAISVGASEILTTDGGWPELPIRVTVI
jgi:predicted nucleic acid-binding protein